MEDIPAQLLNEASPHADIHLLFQHYNSVYFDSMLGAARVEWSSARMTRYVIWVLLMSCVLLSTWFGRKSYASRLLFANAPWLYRLG